MASTGKLLSVDIDTMMRLFPFPLLFFPLSLPLSLFHSQFFLTFFDQDMCSSISFRYSSFNTFIID